MMNNIEGFTRKDKETPYESFIRMLESNPKIRKLKGFKKFKRNLIELNKRRNEWAHGIVFYKTRGKKSPDIPNNFLFHKGKRININENRLPKYRYFPKLNKNLEIVFLWLRENGYLKLKGFKIHY